MANHTPITNQTLEALNRAGLTGAAYQVIGHIMRVTWGYAAGKGKRRQTAKISISQFAQATGLSKNGIIKATRGLLSKNVLTVQKTGGKANIYGVNSPEQWQNTRLTSPRERTSTSPLQRTSERQELAHHGVPDQSTTVYQTSPLPTIGQHDAKENLKENFKESTTPHQDTTPEDSLIDKELHPASRVTSLEDGYDTKHRPVNVSSRRKATTPVKRRAEAAPRSLDYTHGAEPAIGELATEAAADVNEVCDVLWFLESPGTFADIAERQCFGDSELTGRILKVLEAHGWVKQDGDSWQCVSTTGGDA